MIVDRLRSETLIIDRMLGAPDGSIDLIGPSKTSRR